MNFGESIRKTCYLDDAVILLINLKVNLSLSLLKHLTIMTCGSVGIDPVIHSFGIRLRSVVSLSGALYPWRKNLPPYPLDTKLDGPQIRTRH